MMTSDSTKILPETSQVVAGVFTELKNAKDAICDLSTAGFSASQINVAYAHRTTSDSTDGSNIASAEHSIPWKLKKSFEEDLYQPGSTQIAGEDVSLPRTSRYTEVDLHETLSEIGVAEDRIRLLAHEIRDGVLLLVSAGNFTAKAHEIIEQNNGTIRTDTATESAPTLR